jgi:hypothetical protein
VADVDRCPVCALPLVWVRFAGHREHRCTGWERHAQLNAMQRAVSACIAADAFAEADAIAARIERLRTPTRTAA